METLLKFLVKIVMLLMSYKKYQASGHPNGESEVHGHWLLDGSDPDVRYSVVPVVYTRGRCPGSKAPYFNNTDSYATVTNINISDCDFTIACWIRVPLSGRGFALVNSVIFWSVSATGNPLSLSLSKYFQQGEISFALKQMFRPLNYTSVIFTVWKIPSDEWTHIAATCQGNRIRLYVNGDYQRLRRQNISYPITDDFSTDMSSEKFKLYYIGKDPRKEFFSSRKFYGSVMDLHVIGIALSSAEISDLYRDIPRIINHTDEVNGSTVEVTWEQPSCSVVKTAIYYTEVTRAGRREWKKVRVPPGATHYNLQLECFKEYELAVSTHAPPSKLWKVKTGIGQLPPPVITNKGNEINGCKVNITWSPPRNIVCPLSMYTIHYRKVHSLDSENDWMKINVTKVKHTFYLMQLDCGTQYILQMTATNKLGQSKRSKSWQVKTKSGIKDDQNTIVLRAGISAGSIAVVAMVTMGIAVCYRKKWKQKQLRAVLAKRSKSDIVPFLQWEVIPERVTFLEELGRGAFGKVHKGVLREFPSAEVFFKPREERLEVKEERVVAVKVLLEAAGEEGKQQFLQEIDLMKQIGFHRNVLSMLGYWVRSEPILLILEYVPHGDLLQWLRKTRQEHVRYQTRPSTCEETYQGGTKVVDESFRSVPSQALPTTEHDHDIHREETPPSEANGKMEESGNNKCTSSCNVEDAHVKITMPSQNNNNDEDDLSTKDLLCLVWQIAQGMDYLASKGFVHRDLAARNVLLCENRAVKIADFGLLRHTYGEIYETKHTKKLPIKWTAPEALRTGLYTSKSDVWSFGVLLWELATMGDIPYPGVSNKQLYRLLKTGYRMDKPDMCSDEIYVIMLDCWQDDPDKRPTFEKLILILEEMMAKDTPYYDFNKLAENDTCYDEADSENSNTSNQDSWL